MVKQYCNRHHSNALQTSIKVTLLGANSKRKKCGSKDGNIDDASARLCLLGVLNHPKHNVLGTHKQRDFTMVFKGGKKRSLQSRTVFLYGIPYK